MSSKRIILVLASLGLSLGLTGCVGQDAVRAGVEDGVASAVAALIEAPVNAWLDAKFPS